MNCKQGDLAVVVRSVAGNEGKIVRCVHHLGVTRMRRPDGTPVVGHTWFVDPPLRGWDGRIDNYAFDSCLRPIRDNDGEDETLRIVGKPNVKEKDTCTG